MKKIVWITAILITGGVLITAYIMYTNPNPDYAARKPQYTLEAGDLLSAFAKNPEQATLTYMEKVVRVSGTIKMVDTSGSVVITGNDPASEIIFALDPRHKSSLTGKHEGESITVQGICSDYSAGSGDPSDMLATLGATLRFHSAGIKQ